MVTSCVSADIV